MQKRLPLIVLLLMGGLYVPNFAQPASQKPRVRTVTIPVSIFARREIKENQSEEFIQAERLTVREDKEEQQILSIRSVSNSPLSIALIFQDDLSSTFNLQIPDIQKFIRRLPSGTRVMTAYARSGSLQVRQRFTDDLEKAAASLRIVSGSPALAPRSPYYSISETLNRFDAVPAGRRAILLFSDGIDTSEGLNLASISQSFDLDQAILKSQRKGVAVYSFYSPTSGATSAVSGLAFAGQGALDKLSDATGGRSFARGTLAPVSYLPFFEELFLSLNRQFALTYLSTHMKKAYYRLQVESSNPEVRIEHPKGYYFR
jgi:hypothetical protein